jgi:SAM-dependent methyltransferase
VDPAERRKRAVREMRTNRNRPKGVPSGVDHQFSGIMHPVPPPDAAVQDWREIARGSDLLYDVLSWPEKRNAWTEDEFYATGASDWHDFLGHWSHYSPQLGGHCLEIGCGVGRITRQLPATFDRVTALDVSADMIERAQRVAGERVVFHQVNGATIPLQDAVADALFSVHVMQHLENVNVLRAYIAEMARVLRPGGTLMVHVPVHGAPTGRPWRRLQAEMVLRSSRRALREGRRHRTMRTNAYWLDDVWRAFTGVGLTDVELRMIPVRSNGYGHQFWLGRRTG